MRVHALNDLVVEFKHEPKNPVPPMLRPKLILKLRTLCPAIFALLNGWSSRARSR
jgi:hypothetical protein